MVMKYFKTRAYLTQPQRVTTILCADEAERSVYT
jgi:hypothetical protein